MAKSEGRDCRRSRPTILVIEDDLGARQTFEQILRLEGYGTTLCADAESGFEALSRVTFTAVLVDLHLPMSDGVEFLRRLRDSTSKKVPVAVVTGDYLVDDHTREAIRALGAELWFKPLWADDLVDIVRRLRST